MLAASSLGVLVEQLPVLVLDFLRMDARHRNTVPERAGRSHLDAVAAFGARASFSNECLELAP